MKKIWIYLLIFGALQLGTGCVEVSAAQDFATPNDCIGTGDGQSFKDISDSHWAFEPVAAMCSRGIIKGYPDQTFRPEKSVTYGEFIKMASVIFDGRDEGNNLGKIWSAKYYDKLLNNGFYTSFDIPEVKLNWQVTRGDMALILCGLLGDESIADFNQVEKNISDINSGTAHEFEIVKAYSQGILKGYPDRTFRPEENLSRAEAAISLFRVIKSKSEDRIYSLVANLENFRKEDWTETENYKITTPEEVGMELRVPWNGRLAGFDHTMVGFIYLIREGKIIEYCRSIPAATFITSASHFKLGTVDYIMCVPSKHGKQTHILIVRNPFRERVLNDDTLL